MSKRKADAAVAAAGASQPCWHKRNSRECDTCGEKGCAKCVTECDDCGQAHCQVCWEGAKALQCKGAFYCSSVHECPASLRPCPKCDAETCRDCLRECEACGDDSCEKCQRKTYDEKCDRYVCQNACSDFCEVCMRSLCKDKCGGNTVQWGERQSFMQRGTKVSVYSSCEECREKHPELSERGSGRAPTV